MMRFYFHSVSSVTLLWIQVRVRGFVKKKQASASVNLGLIYLKMRLGFKKKIFYTENWIKARHSAWIIGCLISVNKQMEQRFPLKQNQHGYYVVCMMLNDLCHVDEHMLALNSVAPFVSSPSLFSCPPSVHHWSGAFLLRLSAQSTVQDKGIRI